MQEIEKIEKQLDEIKGSVEILFKWLSKDKTEQIRKELINSFFNHHKEITSRDLNKKIKEKLEI